MKSLVCVAIACLCLNATPVAAQDILVARMLTEVCLPYATRAQSFEKSIRAARDLDFRRPTGSAQPLEDWASEIDLISEDGNWRIRIEEGTREQGDIQAYAASCTISSRHASARELTNLGRRAFGNPEHWSISPDQPQRWERRTRRPSEYRLAVEVAEPAGQRPTLTVTGLYY